MDCCWDDRCCLRGHTCFASDPRAAPARISRRNVTGADCTRRRKRGAHVRCHRDPCRNRTSCLPGSPRVALGSGVLRQQDGPSWPSRRQRLNRPQMTNRCRRWRYESACRSSVRDERAVHGRPRRDGQASAHPHRRHVQPHALLRRQGRAAGRRLRVRQAHRGRAEQAAKDRQPEGPRLVRAVAARPAAAGARGRQGGLVAAQAHRSRPNARSWWTSRTLPART